MYTVWPLLTRTYHAVPMPWPCRVAMGLILSFPFDVHSAATFDTHIPCRFHAVAMPFLCRGHTVSLRVLVCLTHLIYIVRSGLIHTYHAVPCHAVPLRV